MKTINIIKILGIIGLLFLLPSISNAQIQRVWNIAEYTSTIPAPPAAGTKVAYRTVNNSLYYWNGSAWIRIAGPGIVDTSYSLSFSSPTLSLLGSGNSVSLTNLYAAGYGLIKTAETWRADTSSPNGLATRLFAKTLPTSIANTQIAYSNGSNLVGNANLVYNNGLFLGGTTFTEPILSGSVSLGAVDPSTPTKRIYLNPQASFGPTLGITDGTRTAIATLGTEFAIGTYTSHILDFRTANTLRMRLASTGNIGIGGTSTSYITDWTSTDAIRLPRGTDAQRPTNTFGLLRGNTTGNGLEFGNGTNWSYLLRSSLAGGIGTVNRVLFNDASGFATDHADYTYLNKYIRLVNGNDYIELDPSNASGDTEIRFWNNTILDGKITGTSIGFNFNTSGLFNGSVRATTGLVSGVSFAAAAGSLTLAAANGNTPFINWTAQGQGHWGVLGFASGSSTLEYKSTPSASNIFNGTTRFNVTTGGLFGIGATTAAAKLHITDNISASSWTTNGIGLRIDNATYTNTTSTGTVALQSAHTIGIPTFAASSATTLTEAANVYIAGLPVGGTNVTTSTNRYALYIGGGGLAANNLNTKVLGSVMAYRDGALNSAFYANMSYGTTEYILRLINSTGTVQNDGIVLQASPITATASSIGLSRSGTGYFAAGGALDINEASGGNINIKSGAIRYYNTSNSIVSQYNQNTGFLGLNTAGAPTYDLDIGGTGAIRMPRGTDAQRPTNAAGLIRWSITNNWFEYGNGTNWIPIMGAESSSIPSGQVAFGSANNRLTSSGQMTFTSNNLLVNSGTITASGNIGSTNGDLSAGGSNLLLGTGAILTEHTSALGIAGFSGAPFNGSFQLHLLTSHGSVRSGSPFLGFSSNGTGTASNPTNTPVPWVTVGGNVGTGEYYTQQRSTLDNGAALYMNTKQRGIDGAIVQGFNISSSVYPANLYVRGTGTSYITGNAVIRMDATAQGFLPPRITTANRNTMTGTITSVNIISAGTTYTSLPTFNYNDLAGGSGVSLTPVLSGGTTGTLTSITVNNGGTGIKYLPSITLNGGGSTSTIMPVVTPAPEDGLSIYNTDTKTNQYWETTTNAWRDYGSYQSGNFGVKTLTPTQEADISGDLKVRDSTELDVTPAHSAITGLLTRNTDGWVGLASLAGGLSYSGGVLTGANIYTADGTISTDRYVNLGSNGDYLRLNGTSNSKSFQPYLSDSGGNGDSQFSMSHSYSPGSAMSQYADRNLRNFDGTRMDAYDYHRIEQAMSGSKYKRGTMQRTLDYIGSGNNAQRLGYMSQMDSTSSTQAKGMVGVAMRSQIGTASPRRHFSGLGYGGITSDNLGGDLHRFVNYTPSWTVQTNWNNSNAYYNWISVRNLDAADTTSGNAIEFYNRKYPWKNASPGTGQKIHYWDNGTPDFMALNTEPYYTITSTSSPQTLSNEKSDNLINQGSTQASFTLTFPASPVDGQVLKITYNNAITSLTLDGNGNTIVGSAVTTGVAGSQRAFKFYSGIGWIKLY